jgi:hypothetical protein
VAPPLPVPRLVSEADGFTGHQGRQ